MVKKEQSSFVTGSVGLL